MYLIVGLGNPGDKYANTRHNAGFMFVDFLEKALSEVKTDEKIKFLKPQTFMNASGTEVKKTLDYYKIDATHLLVAHDDLDIPLGKFKIDEDTGPLLHNGISSIETALGTNEFYRVRLGVDHRLEQKIPGERYVLERFTDGELQTLHDLFPEVLRLLRLEYSKIFPFFSSV